LESFSHKAQVVARLKLLVAYIIILCIIHFMAGLWRALVGVEEIGVAGEEERQGMEFSKILGRGGLGTSHRWMSSG
jgi:hypothetical protein